MTRDVQHDIVPQAGLAGATRSRASSRHLRRGDASGPHGAWRGSACSPTIPREPAPGPTALGIAVIHALGEQVTGCPWLRRFLGGK